MCRDGNGFTRLQRPFRRPGRSSDFGWQIRIRHSMYDKTSQPSTGWLCKIKSVKTLNAFYTISVTFRYSSSSLRMWSHHLQLCVAGCTGQTLVTTIRISITRWYKRYRRRRRFVVASIAAIREDDELNESDIGRINCGHLYV